MSRIVIFLSVQIDWLNFNNIFNIILAQLYYKWKSSVLTLTITGLA